MYRLLLLAHQGAQGSGQPFLILLLFSLAFWFLLIAPQRRKQKEQAQMMAALKTGDDVITSGGIYGTITNVKSDRLIIRTADTTKIEVSRHFIQGKVEKAKDGKSDK
ncbi:MAG: preprotein translocase subunit YajC [Puniceicoccales bacterium]|jgi:preprotein translocase subunit YajC|nr:preprotein translocase subunit YajC [Puniceicoccales bacterium]